MAYKRAIIFACYFSVLPIDSTFCMMDACFCWQELLGGSWRGSLVRIVLFRSAKMNVTHLLVVGKNSLQACSGPTWNTRYIWNKKLFPWIFSSRTLYCCTVVLYNLHKFRTSSLDWKNKTNKRHNAIFYSHSLEYGQTAEYRDNNSNNNSTNNNRVVVW